MKTLTASLVRIPPDVFNRVACQRERVRIDRRGAPPVAIVSIEDLEVLEFLDRLNVQPARDSLSKLRAMVDEAAASAEAKSGRGWVPGSPSLVPAGKHAALAVDLTHGLCYHKKHAGSL